MKLLLQSKLQTVVVIFITLLGILAWGQSPPAAPAPAPAPAAPAPAPALWQESIDVRKEQIKHEERRDFESDCRQLETEIKESYKQCTYNCEKAIEACANGGNDIDLSHDSTNELLQGMAGSIGGSIAGLQNGRNYLNPCNTGASEMSSKKDKVDSEIKDVDKEIRGFGQKEIDAAEAFAKEDKRIEETQEDIKEKIDKATSDLDDKETEKFKELSKEQFEVNKALRDGQVALTKKKQEITDLIFDNKIGLSNFSLTSIEQVCKGEIFKAQVDRCKDAKDQQACLRSRPVSSNLSSAASSGGGTVAARNAQYNKCVNMTTMKYSQELRKQEALINSKKAELSNLQQDLEDYKTKQKTNEEFMQQELAKLRVSKNKNVTRLTENYYNNDKRRIEAQALNGKKMMDINMQKTSLTYRYGMLSSSSNDLSKPIDGLDKSYSGSQAIGIVGTRAANMNRAKDMLCCGENSKKTKFSSGILCQGESALKLTKKKRGGT